jgi:hypothetical protein
MLDLGFRLCGSWFSTRRPARLGMAAVLLAALSGCIGRDAEWASIEEVAPGFLASAHSLHPALAGDGGARVALTFVTARAEGGMDAWIAISRDSGATFAEPVRLNRRAVASSPKDCPTAAFGPDGRLAVAWTEPRDGAGAPTDVVVATSADGGASFTAPQVVNDDVEDRHAAVHAFPAIAFLPDGRLFAAWLDGREYRGSSPMPATACVFGAWSEDGTHWGDNRRLSDRACPCCRPALAVSDPGRIAIAYRSGSANLRDPALLVLTAQGSATADTVISADRWELPGCPTDGLALTGAGDGGSVAWYTGAKPAGIYLMPWRAAEIGARSRRPLSDSLSRSSQPRLSRFGSATWIAVEGVPRSGHGRGVLAVRVLDSGRLTPWCFLGSGAENGALVALGPERALAAWNERGGIRMARLDRRPGS